jgi:hypothetical protein
MELTHNQIETLVQRFPKLELSYETFAHKKVPPNYNICLSIPTGKKQLIWFTFDNGENIAILIDINKTHQIVKTTRINVPAITTETYYGTLLYGTMVQSDDRNVFVIEDLCHYRGRNVKYLLFGEKLTYLQKLFVKDLPEQSLTNEDRTILALPYMRVSTDAELDSLPFYESMTKPAKYATHHIQFRSSSTVAPYLNHIYKKPQPIVEPSTTVLIPRTDMNPRLPAYSKNAVFRVVADIRDDVYHMFAYSGSNSVYVNVAYIGTREQSKYMNSLFRKIKENINIDYGEESDDEETFQDMRVDKYVDLACEHMVECAFNRKFRMWEPIRKVETKHYIHIAELTAAQEARPHQDNRPYPNQGNKPHPNQGNKPQRDKPQYNNNYRSKSYQPK